VLYYRPVSSLSYSLDYAIWGLNPFGYHLTDLLLHTVASLLVFGLMHRLVQRRVTVAWLAAAIFTAHPVLVETVPAIARRQDMIATIFLMLSLYFALVKQDLASRTRGYLVLSLIAYALALGAKEMAIVLPFLILAYAAMGVLDADERGHRPKLDALRAGFPYLLVTALYIGWRFSVLQGIGGGLDDGVNPIGYPAILIGYFFNLLYPVRFVGIVGFLFAMIGFIIMLAFLVCAANSSTLRIDALRVDEFDSELERSVGLLVIWMLLPLALLMLTRTFSHWNLYIAVVPYSGIVAIAVTLGFHAVRRTRFIAAGSSRPSILALAQIPVFCISVGVVIYLLAFSPLLNEYGEWRDSGKLSSLFLHELLDVTPSLSEQHRLHVYDLPVGIAAYQSAEPRAQSVTYLKDYSIESWLELTLDRRIDVYIETYTTPYLCPDGIRLAGKQVSQKELAISVYLE
jgi:hypothetical protein